MWVLWSMFGNERKNKVSGISSKISSKIPKKKYWQLFQTSVCPIQNLFLFKICTKFNKIILSVYKQLFFCL